MITVWRAFGLNGIQPRLVETYPVSRGKGALKLSVEFGQEEVSAFEPPIRHRVPARRRVSCQPKLQLLSPV
jgi:hypothetical protein